MHIILSYSNATSCPFDIWFSNHLTPHPKQGGPSNSPRHIPACCHLLTKVPLSCKGLEEGKEVTKVPLGDALQGSSACSPPAHCPMLLITQVIP